MSHIVKIALVQDSFPVGDIDGNAKKIVSLALKARQNGADLAIFPELALVGYPPEDLLYREEFIRLVNGALQRIKQECSGMDVILGAPEYAGEKLYNAALWLRNGASIATYYKQVLPNYSVFDEKRYFNEGDQSVCVEINGITFGLGICEDAWEEKPFIKAKEGGAQAMIVLNASPFHIGKFDDRMVVLKQRCLQNELPVFYLNTVGGQDELVFDGDSMVIDRDGSLLDRAPAFESAISYYKFDGETVTVENSHAKDLLSEVAAIYKALVLGVKDFVLNNGFKKVVLGLSGGVDSALTLAIAVDAFGSENVHAVMMPSRYTSQMSLDDAELEAKSLGVRYDIISIESTFESILESVSDVFTGFPTDVTEENMQARSRGLILMAISNKTGAMLLTTGNKSELAVGYATLYGDMSGGFSPLKDTYKTLVYKLCRYRNSLHSDIPERVLTRAPSAELAPNQVDQDSLPEYEILDQILELSVEQDKSIDEVVNAGFERDVVEKVVYMVQKNEYKRRQAAPGVRITKRAFGRDRRYPITSGYKSN